MTDTPEALLVALNDRLGELSSVFVNLETTTRTENRHLREILEETRDSTKEMARALNRLGERVSVSESRIAVLQDNRVETAKMDTRLSVLEERVNHNAPQKVTWPTVASALVAITALAWSLFGK